MPRVAAALLCLCACVPAPAAELAELDARALQRDGVAPDVESLRAELTRLVDQDVDDEYYRRVLHIARLAGSLEQPGGLARPLEACLLRMRDPLATHWTAQAVGRLATTGRLSSPSLLARSSNSAATSLAVASLANSARPIGNADKDLLVEIAQSQPGWPAYDACKLLQTLKDDRYVDLARRGLSLNDAVLGLAYYDLLPSDKRPAGFEAFGRSEPRGFRPIRKIEPAKPPKPGAVLVTVEPDRLVELDEAGKMIAQEKLPITLLSAQRIGVDRMLLVAPTRFWERQGDRRVIGDCGLGRGPQNDVTLLADGTALVADGGGFTQAIAAERSGLYVASLTTDRVLWQLPVALPLTARPGPVGTILVAQGEAGLAWISVASGKDLRRVKFDAPCAAGEMLPNGDCLAAVGSEILRVTPAGDVTWRFDLGQTVTSLIVRGERNYLVTVQGKGLLAIDAADFDKPTTHMLFAVPEGTCQVRANAAEPPKE